MSRPRSAFLRYETRPSQPIATVIPRRTSRRWSVCIRKWLPSESAASRLPAAPALCLCPCLPAALSLHQKGVPLLRGYYVSARAPRVLTSLLRLSACQLVKPQLLRARPCGDCSHGPSLCPNLFGRACSPRSVILETARARAKVRERRSMSVWPTSYPSHDEPIGAALRTEDPPGDSATRRTRSR